MKKKLNASQMEFLEALKDVQVESPETTLSLPEKKGGKKAHQEALDTLLNEKTSREEKGNREEGRVGKVEGEETKGSQDPSGRTPLKGDACQGEDEDEEDKISEVKGERTSKMVSKMTEPTKWGEGEVQPPPSPTNSSPAEESKDANASLLSPADVRKAFSSYLDRLQLLALEKAELLLKEGDKKMTPSSLVSLVTSLKDLQMTMKWQAKLSQVILNNPSKLMPPGKGNTFSLLSRLKELTSSVKREGSPDKRGSGQKNMTSSQVDLPGDDEEDKREVVG